MSVELIRESIDNEAHETLAIRTSQVRTLLRVIDALLDIPVDEYDGAALTVRDNVEAIRILRGETEHE